MTDKQKLIKTFKEIGIEHEEDEELDSGHHSSLVISAFNSVFGICDETFIEFAFDEYERYKGFGYWKDNIEPI